MQLSQLQNNTIQLTPYTPLPATPTYDIIVVGLGTAGSLALLAAASRGHRVLGIERQNCMGGTGTSGAVLGYYFGHRGGLFETIDKDVLAQEAQSIYTPSMGINAELKKRSLEQHALSAGATLLFETTVIGVLVDNQTIHGIRWLGPDGINEATARVVIDCTGDAELCAHLGVPMRRGRAMDQQAQPFSNVLVTIAKQRVNFQYTDSGYVNPSDVHDFSRAVIASTLLPTHLKPHYDENPKWLKVATQLGVREGRFIEGDESVTFAQYLRGAVTSEPLFYAYSNLDNHSKDVAFESEVQQDWSVVGSLWGFNFAVPIPLGALIPKGYTNLLVAGRCLSIDHDMAACVRMKRDMQKCGEAAGLVAALSLEEQLNIQDLPYTKLQSLLLQSGCLNEHVALLKESTSYNDDENPHKVWLTQPDHIRDGLASNKPGLAILSASRLGDPIRIHLYQWLMQSHNDHLRKHSALALGLLHDQQAIPTLLEMAQHRDPYVSKTSRKYNSVRGYAAIYLLGKLRSTKAIPILLDIIQHPEYFHEVPLDSEFITSTAEYFFQYFSFSMMALFKIGDTHPSYQQEILTGLHTALQNPDLTLEITLKSGNQLKYNMKQKITTLLEKHQKKWLA